MLPPNMVGFIFFLFRVSDFLFLVLAGSSAGTRSGRVGGLVRFPTSGACGVSAPSATSVVGRPGARSGLGRCFPPRGAGRTVRVTRGRRLVPPAPPKMAVRAFLS